MLRPFRPDLVERPDGKAAEYAQRVLARLAAPWRQLVRHLSSAVPA